MKAPIDIAYFTPKGIKLSTTSHSFRIGYITQLWKDSKDIEFVKQTIGHRNLDTTSAYVNRLSDQERRERISQLDQMCSEKGLGFDLSPSNS